MLSLMEKRLHILMLIACVLTVFTIHATQADIIAPLNTDPDVESVVIGSGVLKNVFKDSESNIDYIGIFNSRNMRGAERIREVVNEFTATPGVAPFAFTDNADNDGDESSVIMYGASSDTSDHYAAIMIVSCDGDDVCVIFIMGEISLSDLIGLQSSLSSKYKN